MFDLHDARQYIERALKIRDKGGEIIPFRLNRPQRRLYEQVQELEAAGLPVRVLVLKARQMGFSTLIEGLMFHRIATTFHVQGLTIAHQEDATNNLFEMTRRFYDHLPEPIKPRLRAYNGRELRFSVGPDAPEGTIGLDSSIRIATAGGRGVGRGFTIRTVHASEYAFWPGDKTATLNGIMQAVPGVAGTMVYIESTANGFDQFKDLWDAAVEAWDAGERDGWCPFFAGWHEMDEYRRRPPDGFERTAEERALAESYGLDDEQLAWRRWCIKTNCGGDVKLFQQEYPACPEEAFVASGTCIFDQQAILLWIERCRDKPIARGRFCYQYDGRRISDITWEDAEDGEIVLFERPEEGAPYVIGGDTAGESGSEWSDYFTAQVLDNRTGAQVARYRGRPDEDEYARQVYCLGMWYERALVAVEINFSTHPTKELDRLGYPNLYVREQTDTYTGRLKKSYGWKTDRITRPDCIAGLKEAARDGLETIRDVETLREMLSFALQAGRAEALPGKHDDLVMALAIAHAVRGQQRTTLRSRPEPQGEKLISQLERMDPHSRRRRRR